MPQRATTIFARLLIALGLIFGVVAMHTSLDASAMAVLQPSAPTAVADSMGVAAGFSAEPAAMSAHQELSDSVMQDVMHACVFLAVAAILAMMVSPAFGARMALPLPRVIAVRRWRTHAPRGIDRTLSLCVLRI